MDVIALTFTLLRLNVPQPSLTECPQNSGMPSPAEMDLPSTVRVIRLERLLDCWQQGPRPCRQPYGRSLPAEMDLDPASPVRCADRDTASGTGQRLGCWCPQADISHLIWTKSPLG